MKTSIKAIIASASLLVCASAGYAVYARATEVTPKSICLKLQLASLVDSCTEGTLDLLKDLPRHKSQWKFFPTNAITFPCTEAAQMKVAKDRFMGSLARIVRGDPSSVATPITAPDNSCRSNGAIVQFESQQDRDYAANLVDDSNGTQDALIAGIVSSRESPEDLRRDMLFGAISKLQDSEIEKEKEIAAARTKMLPLVYKLSNPWMVIIMPALRDSGHTKDMLAQLYGYSDK